MFLRLTHRLHQRRHIQNQRHLAATQNAGARDAAQSLEQAPQGLDDRLLLPQQDLNFNAILAALGT